MQVKAVFKLETESDNPISAVEDLLFTIFANGENIEDYAFIYIREHEDDEWVELK